MVRDLLRRPLITRKINRCHSNSAAAFRSRRFASDCPSLEPGCLHG